MTRKKIPVEALIDLQRKLSTFAPRSHQRRVVIQEAAKLYGVSEDTLYRALRGYSRPKSQYRLDHGAPRVLPQDEMEHYCEIIAAMKIRTSNKKGRHISTSEVIRLLEEYGIHTSEGLIKAPQAVLKKSTVNYYLKLWGYDQEKLRREPVAVRFEAKHSNECWHFDLSHSDLKQLPCPLWIKKKEARLSLMLYSVVDDRSGVSYQEYHCVYGEDVENALGFLFRAMSLKDCEDFPFQGIPEMIYMDNGPIAKSRVFKQVMKYLEIEFKTHMPRGKDGRRTTARSKGKGERPFRTLKELHETLYHFHKPQDEAEANAWLMNFLLRYNNKDHRSKDHSRFEDWLQNIPESGIREMCSWDRFRTFAREPEQRKVGIDARVSVDGISYEVDPDLAGEEVTLWWGIFDNDLYVEFGENRSGAYSPVDGPIPLHHYRSFKKTKTQKRADRIEALAAELKIPKTALEDHPQLPSALKGFEIPLKPFSDPDPFQEITFPGIIAAKKAIADHLGMPLAKLDPKQLEQVDQILSETMNKRDVLKKIEYRLKLEGIEC